MFSSLRRRLLAAFFVAPFLVASLSVAPVHASCTAPCDYDNYVTGTLSSGLVAYYPMYETSGTTMNDTSGHGKNGTYSSSGLTYNGVNGVVFDGSANSGATTPSLDLTPANGGIVTVNLLINSQQSGSPTAGHMLFNQTANFGTTKGAIGVELFNNGAGGTNRITIGQSPDGSGTHYNTSFEPAVPQNTWYQYTFLFRRDQNYPLAPSTTNDCFSGIEYVNGQSQSVIVDQCWSMYGVNFVNASFQLAMLNNHSWPSAITLRGVGFWTRALTDTEIADLNAETFD